MRLRLHIGTEKTGTTTIQRFLALNRDILMTSGVLVPASLGETNHRLLPAMVNNSDFVDDFFRARGLLDRATRDAEKLRWRSNFLTEISRSDAECCVISSEHLQSRLRTIEEVQRLRDLLKERFTEVRIVLYIRHPITTAISLHSTAIKYGATGATVPPPNNPYFNNVVNHERTIRLWRDVFRGDDFCVRLFGRNSFRNGDLVEDFISACSLPELDYKRPSLENESLSLLGLEVLRRINKNAKQFFNEDKWNSSRDSLVKFFERFFSVGPKFFPSKAIVDSYNLEFKKSDEWVRANFFPDRAVLFSPLVGLEETKTPLESDQLDALAAAIFELWQKSMMQDIGPICEAKER